MQAYETSATVQGQGEVRVAGVPFAAEVMISPRRKSAEEFAQAWQRVCSQLRSTPGLDQLTDADIQTEIEEYRAGS